MKIWIIYNVLSTLQAIQWLEDLYHVLLKSHYHVGSNTEEIQSQKEEHQAFQETAKVILYRYNNIDNGPFVEYFLLF